MSIFIKILKSIYNVTTFSHLKDYLRLGHRLLYKSNFKGFVKLKMEEFISLSIRAIALLLSFHLLKYLRVYERADYYTMALIYLLMIYLFYLSYIYLCYKAYEAYSKLDFDIKSEIKFTDPAIE